MSFSAKHIMVTTVRGKFTQVEGELRLDENDALASRGEIRVVADPDDRSRAARQPPAVSGFLDADDYPTVVGKLAGVEVAGDRFRVTVDLTIREMARPVVLNAEFLGIFPGMQGGRRVGFHLAGSLARKEWGLNWNMAMEAGKPGATTAQRRCTLTPHLSCSLCSSRPRCCTMPPTEGWREFWGSSAARRPIDRSPDSC